MIGMQLVDILFKFGARITVVSLDKVKKNNRKIKYIRLDLRFLDNCLKACKPNSAYY